METSAKASINVEEAFLTLASDIKAKMEKRMVCNSIQYDTIRSDHFLLLMEILH